MTDPFTRLDGPTPAMRLLRSRIQPEILSLMQSAERHGADYCQTALEVIATLAEEQAQLFACIADDQWRAQCIEVLHERMKEAVEVAHTKALVRSGVAGQA